MMKIIIDAYQYSPGITGTDRMAYNFLVELQHLDTTNTYIIICSRQKYTRSSITGNNFRVIIPPFVCSLPYLGRYFSYFWRKYVRFRLPRLQADVYYSFHNMSLPERRVAKKMVASNLDLIPIVLDDYKGIGRLSYQEQLADYHRVIDLADEFISISEFSKNELHQVLNVSLDQIKVVHLSADPIFSDPPRSDVPIDGHYIFTVGGSEPRKNVTTVLEAYKMLDETLREKFKLVIAGGEWRGAKLDAGDNQGHIVNLGYVADEILPSLYSNASVFVFASKYEGFGFTILEAMACGVPVINAHGSSLDEVAGDATISFNPNNSQTLVLQLEKLLRDTRLQDELVKKGKTRTKNFSWGKAGKQLYELLVAE